MKTQIMDMAERVDEGTGKRGINDPAKNAWVERVLGVSFGTNGQVPASSAPSSRDAPPTELGALKRRLAAGTDRLKALDDDKIGAALGRTVTLIEDAIDAGDVGSALPLFTRMEDILAAAERRASASTPAQRNLVRYRVLQQEWRIAEGKASAALQAFGKQVLAHPAIAGGPDFDAVKQQVDKLPHILPTFSDQLGEALGSIETAASDMDRAAAAAASHAAISNYQSELLANPQLQALELFAGQNFSGLDVLDQLSAVLQQIGNALDA